MSNNPGISKRCRLLTWNVGWRHKSSSAGRELLKRIANADPDIACITECHDDFAPESVYAVTADADYGYAMKAGRRKVLLWSKKPWRRINPSGSSGMPSGRIIAAETDTPLGALQVIGVCIPWSHAHVSTGRRDRAVWEDHLSYLSGLSDLLGECSSRTVVLGDFNQTVPRSRAPERVFTALVSTFSDGFEVATRGTVETFPRLAIDHVAHSRDMTATNVFSLSETFDDGQSLSDHFGVVADLHDAPGCVAVR